MNKIPNIVAIILMLVSIMPFIMYVNLVGGKKAKGCLWASFAIIMAAMAAVVFDLIAKNLN